MRKFVIRGAVLVVSGSLALSGCTSGKPGPTASTATTKVSSTPLPPEPSFKGTPGGYAKDVKLTACGTEAGTQKVTGTVTNSSSGSLDYSIMVMWLKNGDSTPYGSTLVTVKGVKAGETKEFSAETNVATKVDMCWPRVLGGTLA